MPPPLSSPNVPPQEPGQRHSHLLALPVELQLRIYELALVSPCLLLNYPCCDWHDGTGATWRDHRQNWESGKYHAPHELGLTRTSRLIRKLTIPMFYQDNHFLAYYCLDAVLSTAFQWLDDIGPSKRALLRHCFLFDADGRQDGWGSWEVGDPTELLEEHFGAVVGPPVVKKNIRHRIVFPGYCPEYSGCADEDSARVLEA